MKIEEWVKAVPQLPQWKDLPDIELYMDQLISLGNRYLETIVDSKITSSMVNSYVKKDLMPKPHKKKYSQSHLVSIILITILKQVYSLDDIRKWLNDTVQTNFEQEYDKFSNLFNQTMNQIRNNEFNFNSTNKEDLILQLIIQTVISKLISEKLINNQ